MSGLASEDELVALLRKLLADDSPGVRLGPGDDAALVEMGDHLAVLTTDMMVEGVDFERRTISPTDLGYKALSASVSDVAAMGGSPRFGLVSLGLPTEVEASWVVELYGGLREAAGEYAMSIVGGDTSRADGVVVSVAIVGEVAMGQAILRSGASPGDRIVVTGSLGAAAGGLRIAEAPPHSVASVAGSEWGRELLAAQYRPVARVGEGQALARAGATSMIDVSDGLALDLSRLCRESSVGARLSLDRLPAALGLELLPAVLPDVEPMALVLSGGEDYELLVTLPPEAVEPVTERLREAFGTPLTDIGEIVAGSELVAVEADGTERPLEATGWDHFAS